MNVPMTTWLLYGGGAALVAGSSAAFGLAMRPTGPLGVALARYVAKLDIECRFQFFAIDGRQFFARQQIALIFAITACVYFEATFLWLVPLLAAIGPWFWLRRMRKKRIEKIESQLDGWLLVLANMLKSTGGLGDALAASVDLIRPPIRQELEWTLKEVRLGTALDDALRQLAARVKSSTLATVVTLLVLGRRTGGELPTLLETAAAALREMARLDGLIRSKTSDGRIQTIILALMPVAIFVGFRMMDPHFFDPLFGSLLGFTILGAAVVLWVMALVSARKILNVDY